MQCRTRRSRPQTSPTPGIAPQMRAFSHSVSSCFLQLTFPLRWMGNAEAFGMQFRGASIVQAVLADLISKGLSAGAQLLFAGCSAGGRGVTVHLDAVAEQMEARGVSVRGMLDSSLWVAVTPAGEALGGSLLEETQEVFSWANVTVSPHCLAAYPDAPYKCGFGEFAVPLLQTPYFLSQSSLDYFQVCCVMAPAPSQALTSHPG